MEQVAEKEQREKKTKIAREDICRGKEEMRKAMSVRAKVGFGGVWGKYRRVKKKKKKKMTGRVAIGEDGKEAKGSERGRSLWGLGTLI